MKVLVQSAKGERVGGLHGRDLEVLDEEMARLEAMLQAFLDFARPPNPQRNPVDLRDVVGQTVEFISTRAKRQGISFRVIERAVPALVEGDYTMLRQVLLNLLLNGLDAMPSGGVIEVNLNEVSGRSRGYHLTVADNGDGLPPEPLERLFEPFFSTKETGLGLGLAMCRRIVESHGGKIQASRRNGGGTEFTVWLPTIESGILDPMPSLVSLRS